VVVISGEPGIGKSRLAQAMLEGGEPHTRLRYFCSPHQQLAFLLIVTARPEFTSPWPTDAHVTMQALARLGRRESATLVRGSAAGKMLPAEIFEQILARTDGVPLFLEELTKAVIESGLLHEEDGRYALDGALPPLAIPTTLHDSLMARLDRLAPVREVAQIGAAIGREFPYSLLSAVARQPDDRLKEALDRLVLAELVFGRGEPPHTVYTFKPVRVVEQHQHGLPRRQPRQLRQQRLERLLLAPLRREVRQAIALAGRQRQQRGDEPDLLGGGARSSEQRFELAEPRPGFVSSSTARYSSTARPAASGGTPPGPSTRLRSLASAWIKLASTAKPSPPTKPSAMQRCYTLSNRRRSRSLSRKRPWRFFEKVE
jgi:hypothetical protein